MPKKPAEVGGKTKTIEYDVAAQLRTPEERSAYLDAWLAEAPDDAEGNARAHSDVARASREEDTFEVPPELEDDLLESIAEADRDETIPADALLERLRQVE